MIEYAIQSSFVTLRSPYAQALAANKANDTGKITGPRSTLDIYSDSLKSRKGTLQERRKYYHHAKLVCETYWPHLDPVDRLWGVMHQNVIAQLLLCRLPPSSRQP